MARAVSNAKSIDDLKDTFQKTLSNFDLERFTYQIIKNNHLHNKDNFYVTTFQEEWERHYLSENYFDADPLVNKYRSSYVPFLWTEQNSVIDHKKTKIMFEEASSFNLHHGIGIPIHGPLGSFSILTLCSSNGTPIEIAKTYEHFQKDILIAGLLFHNSLISLNLENTIHQRYELTNKELECLKWLCAGKSNRDIADILGITEAGIKDRVKRIYNKMGVFSRHEALLKAYNYKTIEL